MRESFEPARFRTDALTAAHPPADQVPASAVKAALPPPSTSVTLTVRRSDGTVAAQNTGSGAATDAGTGGNIVCFLKEGQGGGVSNIQLEVECCIPDAVLATC